MIISNGGSYSNKVAFGGQKKVLDQYGLEKYKFYYPYDSKKYDAHVEFYDVETTKDGKYKVIPSEYEPVKLDSEGNSGDVNINKLFRYSDKFAYRFVITKKGTNDVVKKAFDPGIVTNIQDLSSDDNKFNIVFKDRAIVNKDGKMQLIMPDEYYPGVIRDYDGKLTVSEVLRNKALSSVRTHTNKLGGTLKGIMYKLPELKEEGYTRIVGMPITKDTVSSHLYWTQNAFQVSPQLGGMEDFKTFQKELFKNGINWISDAALVNEGLQGLHFANVLKWGTKSPYYNWFKAPGLQNEGLKLGILPAKTEHVRYKLVNSPYQLDSQLSANDKYDPKKPTYVQFYDIRLVTREQEEADELIETYENNNPKNSYDITAHDDVIYPYSFEIDPAKLLDNIQYYQARADKDIVDLQSIGAIKKVMVFDNFSIVSKPDASGFEMWDGNTDIAKLNFFVSKSDLEEISKLPKDKRAEAQTKLEQGVLQVVDSAVNSGKYWTKLAADIQLKAAADVLKGTKPTLEDYRNKIEQEVEAGNLPPSTREVMTDEVIENILADDYAFPRLKGYSTDSAQEYVLRQVMDYPLESLPFSSDLLAVLSSPYIQKRATTKDEIGLSRLDIYKAGENNLPEEFKEVRKNANKMYEQELKDFMMGVINLMDIGLIEKDKPTEKGKYIINEIMPELMQYAMIKGVDPDADIRILPNGKIDFSRVNPEKLTLHSAKIAGLSPEDEANKLVKHIRRGISYADKLKIAEAFQKRYSKIDLTTYKMADAIVDRTESGMGWRIDAAKDVSSIDSVKAGADNFAEAWENVIFVWKKFNEAVKDVNPHVYTTAEITDVNDLIDKSKITNADNGRFEQDTSGLAGEGVLGFEDVIHPETKFIEETGITTTANYSFFYSLVPELYTKSGQHGGDGDFGQIDKLKGKLDYGWGGEHPNPGFMFNTPLDGVLHSYTFVGNHDKPRLLHTMALDMQLFYTDFKNDDHKKTAARVLGYREDEIGRMNFSKISPQAVAMGDRLRKAFDKALGDDKAAKVAVNKAIATIAGGHFKGHEIKPDAFGARPFEIAIQNVIEEVNHQGFPMDRESDRVKDLEAKILGDILEPACDKYLSVYKTLVTLPGDVTDFAGDKILATGYESKAKNLYQQNRNTIRWEWLEDSERRSYAKKFRDDMNSILALRNDPKLSALNDGVPVTLTNSNDSNFASVLRYNDKGSVVLTVYNTNGANRNNEEKMSRFKVTIDEILLDRKGMKEGLAGGLSEGTTFKSTNPKDEGYEFRVVSDKSGKYSIKKFKENSDDSVKITMRPDDYNSLVLYKV